LIAVMRACSTVTRSLAFTEPPSPAPTPLEQAARLRGQALAACDAQDPAGESDPRIVAARAAIAGSSALAPTQEPSALKPPAQFKPSAPK
jgi:hypothetical protein